ncbi:MAG: chromosome segregation in meiosis- protein [Candelina mexicana]|nr:MAG: chromosome segregation in meiosis- protein [Candelina mexicana]
MDSYRSTSSNDISAPQPTAQRSAASGPDELDDLFDYDAGIDEAFRNAENALNAPLAIDKNVNSGKKGTSAGLGIDEEIKVTRKRKPIAKLDETRLLSPAGIPKLRRISKDRLKFRGKGHEYTDVARLLNIYQLWLDDLYPRAKFADGLAIIEKLGHTKRMQVMRRQWIDEGKPRTSATDDAGIHAMGTSSLVCPRTGSPRSTEPSATAASANVSKPRTPTRSVAEEQDIYDVTPGIVRAAAPAATGKCDNMFLSDDEGPDKPDDDDLDALLAEDARTTDQNGKHDGIFSITKHATPKHPGLEEDNFEDEMEAMADMDDLW